MRNFERERIYSRRANKLNLLTVATTPAFPIPITSDVLFKEGNFLPSRTRSPSVAIAEVITPENHSKLFSQDLIGERLSLTSNDSVVSSASENEKSSQPIDQDKICLQLSDWLIQTMEQKKWREITENIDFQEEVDPASYLFPQMEGGIDGQNFEWSEHSLDDYQREEGNSVFYATSSQDSSQVATTSRVYEVATDECEPTTSNNAHQWSFPTRRFSDDTDIGRSDKIALKRPDKCMNRTKRSKSIQDLIIMLAESTSSQSAFRRTEILNTFEIPTMRNWRRNWRPPRKKFIFELSKHIDFSTQLAQQKYRCAGCGLKIEQKFSKRALYCHYYSKLFCACCHQGMKARIPARILHEWNFKEYPVCDIAYKFLAECSDQPVFNVRLINPALYRKAKNLRKFRKLRIKITHMWPFVQICNIAAELLTEHGFLRTIFSSIPKRFLSLELIDVYSLLDFERIANRNLIELVEPLAQTGAAHIENCQRCRQNAFLCQICMDPADLLFPFQLDRVERCDSCGSLTHLKCYKKSIGNIQPWEETHCKKCERIRRKKFHLQRRASSDNST